MMKNPIKFFLIPIALVLISILIVSCGGGSDNIVSPNLNPAPVLVTKDISGFIYYVNNLEGSQAGEEETGQFIILDTPITGEDSFLTQMKSSLEETGQWNPDAQELYALMEEEMAGYVPLPGWNANAKLFSSYQDTRNDQPLTVNNDGFFEGSVAVSSADDVVDFIVLVGEEEVYEAKTIASSDILTESQTSGELKSCPEMVLTKPGRCQILKIYADPAINLHEAGLTLTLNDSSLGKICGPFYLRIRGKKNYNVAFAIFKANRGLSTPVDTTITASTNTGLSKNIFTEVVKSTASVSGHVGGQGVIPKFGFVFGCGPWAFDFLDNNGDYHLKKVYQGHYRTVTAIYWLDDGNGNWIKYKESRVIDFLQGDLGDFHIPQWVLPTPTPVVTPTLRLPSDPYYDKIVSKVISQKWEWEEELGIEAGVQKTVDWLNNLVPEAPVPPEIAEVIVEAKVNEYDSKRMKLYFTNGMVWALEGYQWPLYYEGTNSSSQNRNLYCKTLNSIDVNTINSTAASTVKNSDIVILWPYMWQQFYSLTDQDVETTVYALGDILKEEGYDNVKCVGLRTFSDPIHPDPNADITFEYISDISGTADELRCKISKPDNIIRPQDFEDLDQYGVIYIATHGYSDGIVACPAYFEDEELESWIDDYSKLGEDSVLPNWEYSTTEYPHIGDPVGKGFHVKAIKLTKNFFYQQDFSGSLVYINACESYEFHRNAGFWDAKVYLGYKSPKKNGTVANPWCDYMAYYYFYYLMYEFIDPVKVYPADFSYSPPEPLPDPVPMSVRDAYEILKQVEATPDQNNYPIELDRAEDAELLLDTGVYGVNDDTYFPVSATITVNNNQE